MLVVKNLTKIYEDGTLALDNISFTVKEKEFLVIIGLSGSGKSTLLRCINRLIEPTSGEIFIDGINVTAASQSELRKIRQKIGMVFQQFNLVNRSKVITNVLSGRLGYVNTWLSMLNIFPQSEIKRAMDNLRLVRIESKAYNRADSLSGGQQQRVGIARALMQEPALILADEPVASLDPATSHSVMKYIEQINQEKGTTILCCLHFLSLARRYGTRILALKDAKIVFEGLPKEIDDKKFKEIYGEEAIKVEIA